MFTQRGQCETVICFASLQNSFRHALTTALAQNRLSFPLEVQFNSHQRRNVRSSNVNLFPFPYVLIHFQPVPYLELHTFTEGCLVRYAFVML